MKKSNVLVIATVLIALHALAFVVFIGSKSDKAAPPQPTVQANPAPAQQEPRPRKEFKVPELKLPQIQETQAPPQTTTPPAVKPADPIAVPGSREGYMRSDRPDRRTSRVYDKLVGDPYQGAIVIDAHTGKILYERRATTYAYPASVTKLMTLLLVLERIESGAIRLDDKVEITRAGMNVGGSQAYLDVRESGLYSVDDLLKALMIHSANDAAAVLAIHVAGSKEAFVDLMNQKARELGMNSTVYHSVHGLPPSGGSQPDISTPYDIALLSLAVLRHPDTLHYTGTRLDYMPPSPLREKPFMLANRNAMVDGAKESYTGCDGLKTGYHSKGGFSLAATAERNGQRVVVVTLGSPDKHTRNQNVRELLDKGFEILSQP